MNQNGAAVADAQPTNLPLPQPKGAVLYLKGTGRDAHANMSCPAAVGAKDFLVCTACLESAN